MKIVGTLVLAFLISACGPTAGSNDGGNDPGGPGGGADGGSNGGADGGSVDGPVRLTKRGISTEVPSIVKAAFHVNLMSDGAAVSGLGLDDFEVLEDGSPISPSESFLAMVPTHQIPYTLKTVIALDVSSSLSVADVETAKQAARNLIADSSTGASRLLPGQEIALYTFDDQISLEVDFTSDVQALLSAIDGISRGGPSTNLYGAIVSGMSRWEDVYSLDSVVEGAMIIVTDGNDTAGIATKEDARTAASGKRLFAIPVGSEVVRAAFDEIAGSANVIPAADYTQLQNRMAEVVDRMSRSADGLYFLYYATPKRSGTHSIEVKFRGSTNPEATIHGEFSADGFQNVVPEVFKSGPSLVTSSAPVSWEVRTRWSNDPASYSWVVIDPGGLVSFQKTGPTADGRGETATFAATDGRCGVVSVQITDNNHSASLSAQLEAAGCKVGGTVSGLNGATALSLRNNGSVINLAADGPFEFPEPMKSGASYAVTVATTPNGLTCRVGNGTGSITGISTTNVQVTCAIAFAQFSAGGDHSMAIRADGTLWGWGQNYYGQIGTTGASNAPAQVGSGYTKVSSGYAHTVALKSDGTLWAWGWNTYGQVGDGSTTDRNAPVQIGTGFVDASAGVEHSVAIKSDGTLWAWGRNAFGQLGDGTQTNRLTPVQVGSGYVAVEAGNHTMAVDSNGVLWTWGDNGSGQLGKGNVGGVNTTPYQVGTGFVAVSASQTHSLAIKQDGTLWAWGSNSYGQAGNGVSPGPSSPVQIGTGFSRISAGYAHSLGVKTDGTVWAWGWNQFNQLGDGTTTNTYAPKQVLGVSNATGVSAGHYHSVALTSDGQGWAWGRNSFGTLGDGTNTNRSTPVQIY